MDSVASEIEIRLVMFTEFKVQIPTQIQSKAKQSTIRRHSEVFSLTFVCWIDLVCVTKMMTLHKKNVRASRNGH